MCDRTLSLANKYDYLSNIWIVPFTVCAYITCLPFTAESQLSTQAAEAPNPLKIRRLMRVALRLEGVISFQVASASRTLYMSVPKV
ncbi:hypothetical protein [Fischerella sp. PCC 9605]|uniref:hypothetical protein n=1 Tax=Fischerella sp. PCC 9605 TaxID=1173024 RepID=UPI000479E3FF|nr:hypothetical protein [Fischerella sp. PCC 9605]